MRRSWWRSSARASSMRASTISAAARSPACSPGRPPERAARGFSRRPIAFDVMDAAALRLLHQQGYMGRNMRQVFQFMLALAPLWLAVAPVAHAQNAADPTVSGVRYIEVMPASQEQAAGLIKKLADASRKQAGVVRFDVLQRTAPANQFATFEIWKDQASLDAHGAAAHKQFLDAAQPLLIAPVDDRLCIAIDTAPPQAGGEGAIYAITHVDVGPPNRDAGIALLKTVAGPSRKENGNLAFDA